MQRSVSGHASNWGNAPRNSLLESSDAYIPGVGNASVDIEQLRDSDGSGKSTPN
jgi:hypothetical protein